MQIKRDDTIYLEIEQFEDYELTNNIAFEMAVRNDDVIKSINRVIRGYSRDDVGRQRVMRELGFKYPYIGLHLQKSLKLTDEQRGMLKYLEGRKKVINPYGGSMITTQSKNVEFVSTVKTGRIEKITLKDGITDDDIAIFLNEIIGEVWKGDNIRGVVEVEEFKNNITMEKKPSWLNKAIKHKDISHILDVKYVFNTTISKRKSEAEIYATIITKRPLMMIDTTAKIVNTSFNMSLELNELKAQIEIIKNEFDKNFRNIKSTAEHFNIELEKADKLICDTNGKCIDPRGYLTKQQKMADMFFIYDCLKAGQTEIAIKYAMSDYYENDNGIDSKTIKKYKDIATKYIDNFGYKELLTGVKNI